MYVLTTYKLKRESCSFSIKRYDNSRSLLTAHPKIVKVTSKNIVLKAITEHDNWLEAEANAINTSESLVKLVPIGIHNKKLHQKC